MRPQTPTQQKHRKVRQNNAVSQLIPWLIPRPIDIARNDAVQVPPSDHESQRHATLVHSFDVVGTPTYGVSYARIDSKRSQEGSSVFDSGGGGGSAEQHGETGDAQDGGSDVAPAAGGGAVGEVADEDCEDCGGWTCGQYD